MAKKVVFAVPREEDPVVFTFAPLAVLSLAKQVEQAGYEPVILDAKQLEDDFLPRVRKALSDDAAMLWLSGKTGRQLKDLCDAGRAAKEVDPNLPVAFGGWHATMDTPTTLNTPWVDYVVRNQGEYTLPELLLALDAGSDVTQIAGLAGRDDDGRIWYAPERPWERNMDKFGPLPWHMIDMEFYITGNHGRCQPMVTNGRRTINYTYSRGCHGMCSFCHITALWQRAWFSQTPEFVLDQMEHLIKEYKVDGIDFHDSNFFTGLPRARQIVRGMIDRGFDIRWKCSVRADQVNAFDDELMEDIVKAGGLDFAIGAEGGTNRVMGLVAKEIVPNDVIACSKKCAKYGILPEYSFMVGFPDEKNWEDTKATLAFMARLRQISPNALAEYFYYTPFPGTPLFQDYAQKYMPRHETIEDYVRFSTYTANMPWVDKKLPRILTMATSFYFKFAIPNDSMKAKMAKNNPLGIALRIMNKVADWRVRHRRYEFPIEYKLARLIKDLIGLRFGSLRRLQEAM
ncbi:MAG: B12-binding domain-containing radical SAM protein [Deltaproteobacteria bacterium]|nr:B12-binding domain-containing radical SAM protein [bacterium]MCB9477874.1 B12-binding domain-containing radical SAM protein [Deltaproteobacteria bacterium]MCB9478699.1 B12-binding domain-containing radical SAM protein [Deltaproteobacteria bacterium]MCB9488215.1 B12-binding domain-containing radical SAM protein [Deltaproteobacteria bacterium]